MSTKFRELTPQFNCAIENILSNSIAEKVLITINKATITLLYKVKTAIKDIHRKYLKARCCDTCITKVFDDETEFKVTFSNDNAIFGLQYFFNTLELTTIEIMKSMAPTAAIQNFVDIVFQNNRYSYK